MFKKLLILVIIALVVAPSVMADRRKYAWTYGYTMVPQDQAELEFYQTTKLDETNSWEYRIEVEQGITQDFDFAVYQIFSQKEGQSFKWDAFQFRARYRLADPGEFFLDPLLYIEYKRKTDLKAQNKLEAKLLLARDFNKINFAINPLYEFFWAPGDPVHEIGADMGISYAPNYKFSIGFESVVRYEMFKNKENKSAYYAGPSFSFASGTMFYTAGYLFGLNDDANDGRVRFLMGVGL